MLNEHVFTNFVKFSTLATFETWQNSDIDVDWILSVSGIAAIFPQTSALKMLSPHSKLGVLSNVVESTFYF